MLDDAVIVFSGVDTDTAVDKGEDVATGCDALGSLAKHHCIIEDPHDISPSTSIHSIPSLDGLFFVRGRQPIASSSLARVLGARSHLNK